MPMRQLGVGELLDTAIKLYRRHWKVFIAIVAVVMAPFVLVQAYAVRETVVVNPFDPGLTGPSPEPSAGESAVVLNWIFNALQFFVLTPFLSAAVGRAAADVYLGRAPELAGTYRFAAPRIGAILWVIMLTIAAVAAGPAVVAVFAVLADTLPLLAVALALAIFPGILLAVRFSFGPITVVVEDGRGTNAMRRSWRLSRGSFWKIFGTFVLAYILAGIVAVIIAAPLVLLANTAGGAGWLLWGAGQLLGEIVTRPFLALVIVLLYFDMRIRKEGLDLSMAARSLGLPG